MSDKTMSKICYLICAFGVLLMIAGRLHALTYFGLLLAAVAYIFAEGFKIPRSEHYVKPEKKQKTAAQKRREEQEHFIYWNLYCNKHNRRR